jgi:hypothetical protein
MKRQVSAANILHSWPFSKLHITASIFDKMTTGFSFSLMENGSHFFYFRGIVAQY